MESRTFLELMSVLCRYEHSLRKDSFETALKSKEGIQTTRALRKYKNYIWFEYDLIYNFIMNNDTSSYTEMLSHADLILKKELSEEYTTTLHDEILRHDQRIIEKYLNIDKNKTLRKNFDDIQFISIPKYKK